jgi:sulfate adenylyltransferase subunit 2
VPCTFPIDSNADTIDKIIAELEASKTSERAGRATDQEAEDAFEQLRLSGHM